MLKPCSSQFYVSLRYFYFGAVPSVIFSFALLIYALFHVGAKITVVKAIIFFIDIVAAIVICYSIWFLIMILSIIFIKIGAMHELFLSALKFLEYPQNIYKGMIRILMIYIIPLATVSNVPGEKLLGKVGMIDTIEIVLLSIVFFMLTRIYYRLALKRYSSASS